MDCEANVISCQLEEIALALHEPAWMFWLSIAIPAAAAAGTLWIGWLNFKLLRAQNRRQKESVEKQERMKRVEYGALLRAWVLEAVDERRKGLEPGTRRSNDDALNVARVGALTGEKSQDDLATFFAMLLTFGLPAPRDETDLHTVAFNAMDLIDRWVEDPNSTTFDSKAVLTGGDPFGKE